MTANKAKIMALMSAKDDLERASAKLRIEGYASNNKYQELQGLISLLRRDIINMQCGCVS